MQKSIQPFWSHQTYVDFYRATYGKNVVAVTPTAHPSVSFIEADQGAGDWSDAPTSDLILTRVLTSRVMGTVDLGAGRFRTPFGDPTGILVAPGCATSIYVESPHRIRILSMDYKTLLELAAGHPIPADGDFGRLHGGALQESAVYDIEALLWSEVQAGNPHGRLYVEAALMLLLATLARLAQQKTTIVSGGLAAWQLRRTTEYLEERLAEPVSLAELAAVARLSPFHFARAFKASTGQPPHRYHTLRRIERAKEMLQTTDLTVTEIAMCLGLDSSQTLARVFRESVGCTPTTWRRERRL